jgi:hypothetical protein
MVPQHTVGSPPKFRAVQAESLKSTWLVMEGGMCEVEGTTCFKQQGRACPRNGRYFCETS